MTYKSNKEAMTYKKALVCKKALACRAVVVYGARLGPSGFGKCDASPASTGPALPSPSGTLAPGIEVRVFTARKRVVVLVVLDVPGALRRRDGIWLDHLIVRATKMPNVDSAMVGRLSKHRRGDGCGKNCHSAENFEFGHGGLHLIWGSPPLDVS